MNKMILGTVAILMSLPLSANAEFKIAVVDTQKAILETKAGKKS